MPKVEKEELGSLSNFQLEKLQRLYTQGFAACGSVRNLAKAAKLFPSKVREFLHSKTSYTKFTQAIQKFRRLRTFARFKGEIWCTDLAYLIKLAKDNNGVKYLLVRKDLFDRTVNAKGMKTKDTKETVKTFSKMITKTKRPKKTWISQGTEFAGKFKIVCSAEGVEIYSTLSRTKAAFAWRTIRSLKNIFYRYMEDYGYNFFHKLPQPIATMNSRNNRSTDKKPNHVKNSDFMSILYSKPLREYKNPKLGIGDRVHFSEYKQPFRKRYKPQYTQEVFDIIAIDTKKPPKYTIKDEQEEAMRRKFQEKELVRVIWVWIHLQSSWFLTHLHSSFQTTPSVHSQISCRRKWIWEANGRWQFPRFLYHQSTNTSQRGKLSLTMRNSPKQKRLTV